MPKQTELKHIPLGQIRESQTKLRSVDRQDERYLGLVDSIRLRGILNPVSVREMVEGDEVYYLLTDGLHRFFAAKDAGLETIPAQVTNMEDGEVLIAQIMANVHKIETKPVQYSKALLKVLSADPLLTNASLATKLAKSGAWINERLGLLKLHEDIAELVDGSKINLSNAYALAKLPFEDQSNYLERAMTLSPQEFVPMANTRIKQIRDAKRQGADVSEKFVPSPHLQKISALKDELDRPTVGALLIKELKIKDPVEAFILGIQWCLHLDPKSVAIQKEKYDTQLKIRKENKDKRTLERQTKKAEEARKKAEALDKELEETS